MEIKFVAGCQRLQLLFLFLNFISKSFCACWVAVQHDTTAFAARTPGVHTPQYRVFGTLKPSDLNNRKVSFLWARQEIYPALRCRLGGCRSLSVHLRLYATASSSPGAAAPPATASPLSPADLSNPEFSSSAAAAEFLSAAADAAAALPFTTGLSPDSSLPPRSSSAPLVDLSLCKRNCFSPLLPPGINVQFKNAKSAAGLFRAVGPEGPVSFFDERKSLNPALAGASDDAYFIGFYGPIQVGAFEVAKTTLAAAKRFVQTRKLQAARRRQGPQKQEGPPEGPPEGPHPLLRQKEARHGIASDANSQKENGSKEQLKEARELGNVCVNSVDLYSLLREERFNNSSPPYWLIERVAFALRHLRPLSFGLLVGQLLQAISKVAEAEGALGVSIDAFASARMQRLLTGLQRMQPQNLAMFLTRGSPREFKDVFKFKRGFPVFPWGVSRDPKDTRSFIKTKLKVTEESLTQHFFAARRVAGPAWASSAFYRLDSGEIPAEEPRKRIYEGFNSAAIACIKQIAAEWQRPVYVLSVLERARSLRQLLKALGVSKEAMKFLHVCGADGILMGTDADGQRPREVPPGVRTPEGEGGAFLKNMESAERSSTANPCSVFSGVCTPEDAQARGVASKLNGAMALWNFHVSLGFRGVPHFIDDDIKTLQAAAAHPKMEGWRLYFCDWGFSTFEEKLQAVISDRIKILPTMARMADLLLTPAFSPARRWALGSTTAPAEWLEEGRMRRWLRLSGALQPTRESRATPHGEGRNFRR